MTRVSIPTGAGTGARGKRGKIRDFSRAAALNLLRSIQSVDRRQCDIEAVGFLTLTYPARFPTPCEAKHHLDVLLKRLRRKFPDIAGWWKLEPQKRGAPHFHLLLFFPHKLTDAETVWCAEAWHDIAGQGDERHLNFALGLLRKSRPCLERIRTWNGAASYAHKYICKPVAAVEGWEFPGRFWGKINADALPTDVQEVALTPSQAVDLKRQLRRYQAHQPTTTMRFERFTKTGHRKVRRICKPTPGVLADMTADGFWSVRPVHQRRRARRNGGTWFVADTVTQRLLEWAQARPPRDLTPAPARWDLARRKLDDSMRRMAAVKEARQPVHVQLLDLGVDIWTDPAALFPIARPDPLPDWIELL